MTGLQCCSVGLRRGDPQQASASRASLAPRVDARWGCHLGRDLFALQPFVTKVVSCDFCCAAEEAGPPGYELCMGCCMQQAGCWGQDQPGAGRRYRSQLDAGMECKARVARAASRWRTVQEAPLVLPPCVMHDCASLCGQARFGSTRSRQPRAAHRTTAGGQDCMWRATLQQGPHVTYVPVSNGHRRHQACRSMPYGTVMSHPGVRLCKLMKRKACSNTFKPAWKSRTPLHRHP